MIGATLDYIYKPECTNRDDDDNVDCMLYGDEVSLISS